MTDSAVPPSFPAAQSRDSELVQAIFNEIQKAVVGQEEVIEQVLTCLIAAGHAIIEGLPGLGKTLLVRALAKTFAGSTRRIQFTPDLMPSDITGHVMYDVKSGDFHVRRGPVFTNLLLADEINRAPAKTQAALLEVMQEGQVTLEGESHALPPPFMTLATQNPWEQEGTYPLPDAQLDRFLLKVHIGYPGETEEVAMVAAVTDGKVGDALTTDDVSTVCSPADVLRLQAAAARVRVDSRIREYAVRIVRKTRQWPGLALGAGPRGCLALTRAARARALFVGRDFAIPDDIKDVALPSLRHRIVLAAESELDGQSPDAVIADVLAAVEAPRQ